jgi:2',3'-cyclic-nucleotide 2'-phosphodiesterase/3'-nucleotidase
VTSASGKLAEANAAGIGGLSLVRDNGDGSSTYAIDLSVTMPAAAARHGKTPSVR